MIFHKFHITFWLKLKLNSPLQTFDILFNNMLRDNICLEGEMGKVLYDNGMRSFFLFEFDFDFRIYVKRGFCWIFLCNHDLTTYWTKHFFFLGNIFVKEISYNVLGVGSKRELWYYKKGHLHHLHLTLIPLVSSFPIHNKVFSWKMTLGLYEILECSCW